jgi:hypothetical protein
MAESLPPPPSVTDLQKLGPEVHVLPAGTVIWRVYLRGGLHPATWDTFRTYGPTGARFDHHDPPPSVHPVKAILYGADRGPTCLAEVFQDTRVIDRHRHQPALAAFQLVRDLALLDVTGAWPTRAGASMAIGTGRRKRAREWSRAIYDAFPQLEGIRYASPMDANRPAFALYERSKQAIPAHALLDALLSAPGLGILLARAAARFQYRLR